MTGEPAQRRRARVPDRAVVGRLLVGVGVVGAVAGILATIVGVRLLGQLDRALADSVAVTAEAVEALSSSVEVAGETIVVVEGTLERTESTTREVVAGLSDAQAILEGTAELSENQIAGSLEAVDRTLPTLVQVASVIDSTLSALSAVPFGPDYDPQEPFEESLRAVHRELADVPDALREQAELIREGSERIGDVREGTAAVADDLGELQAQLASAGEVLEEYAGTATRTRDLVTGNQAALDRQLAWARILVAVLGAAVVVGQLLPLGAGWLLLRPELAAAFLRPDADGRPPA